MNNFRSTHEAGRRVHKSRLLSIMAISSVSFITCVCSGQQQPRRTLTDQLKMVTRARALAGQVIGPAENSPLPGATVTLYSNDWKRSIQSVTSLRDGRFSFDNLATIQGPAEYHISVQALGMNAQALTVQVRGDSAPLRIVLTPQR
jgi:hypothetical protein